MLKTLVTLSKAFNSSADDAVRDKFSVELINQNIRESEGNLKLAKSTLASLIMRHRNEEQASQRIASQIADLETRAKAALQAGNEQMAVSAAEAIADLENEKSVRDQTVSSLDQRISQIKLSIEKAHRRLTSLKQGAVAARAVVAERKAQKRIASSIQTSTTYEEAEELIARVVEQADPFEEANVLQEIENELSHTNLSDKMAAEGFGEPTKSQADNVLSRLKSQSTKDK